MICTIEKGKDGFVIGNCLNRMYENLPICVVSYYEGMYPTIEYVDWDNWNDIVSDFSKVAYRKWFPISVVKEPLTTENLTWQDMLKIADIIGHTQKLTEDGYVRDSESFYTEVLEKFKEG